MSNGKSNNLSGFDDTINDALSKSSSKASVALRLSKQQATENACVSGAARSDGWKDYELMLDPSIGYPTLKAKGVRRFILNLSNDNYLLPYFKSTSHHLLGTYSLRFVFPSLAKRAD